MSKYSLYKENYSIVIFHRDDKKTFYLFEGPIDITDNGVKCIDVEGHEHIVKCVSGIMSINGVSEENFLKTKDNMQQIDNDPFYENIDYVYIKCMRA